MSAVAAVYLLPKSGGMIRPVETWSEYMRMHEGELERYEQFWTHDEALRAAVLREHLRHLAALRAESAAA